MISALLGGWNRLMLGTVGAVVALLGFLGYRASLISRGRRELTDEIKVQIGEQLKKSADIERETAGMDDSAVRDWLLKRASR